MSIIPVRELGRVGVISDIPGYNIPINAVTRGINVRFDEGSVSRAPPTGTGPHAARRE